MIKTDSVYHNTPATVLSYVMHWVEMRGERYGEPVGEAVMNTLAKLDPDTYNKWTGNPERDLFMKKLSLDEAADIVLDWYSHPANLKEVN